MTRVTARIPENLLKKIDGAARSSNRSRAQIIRQAIEYYLADTDDLRLNLERLGDPAEPVLDWDDVKRDLLAADKGACDESSRNIENSRAKNSQCQA
jgi:transposase